jgi:hypothetical protein
MPTPPQEIAISSEAAAQLESRIQQNLVGEPGRQFIMRMSDSEVTSLVAAKLVEYGDSPIEEPQIWFTRGKVYGSGRLVNVLPIQTKFYIVALPRIEGDRLVVSIEESSAGALPIPGRILETISRSVSETLDELQLELQVTALEILEGEAILQGFRR